MIEKHNNRINSKLILLFVAVLAVICLLLATPAHADNPQNLLRGEMFHNSNYYNQDLASACAELCCSVDDLSAYFPSERVSYYHSTINSDSFHVSIGYQPIEVDGSARSLVSIIFRGTGNFGEAMMDFLKDIQHFDFYGEKALNGPYKLKVAALEDLNDFTSSHPAVTEQPIIYLVTGYSLGGAAANLLGADLTNLTKAFGSDRVFVYTFGAIKAIAKPTNAVSGYHNIFNIYNYYDSWGPHGNKSLLDVSDPYYKFGHTLFCYFDNESSAFSLYNHDMGNYKNETEQLRVDVSVDRKSGILDAGQWWKLTNNTLYIYGTGELNTSWNQYTDEISDIVIKDGITGIGDYFYTHPNLETIYIPTSVASIGHNGILSFELSDIYYEGTLEQWNAINMDSDTADELAHATLHCLSDDPSLEEGLPADGDSIWYQSSYTVKRNLTLNRDMVIFGDLNIDSSGSLNLNGHTVTVGEDTIIKGDLTINGSLDVAGNVYHNSGRVSFTGTSHFGVGDDYRLIGGELTIDGGALEIGGDHIIGYVDNDGNYKNNEAKYYIKNDGTETVAGSVLAYSMYRNELNTGELHIGGDFRSLGYEFNITPEFYVTMTGTGATRIENVGRSVASASYYPGGNLTIENAEGREVTFAGIVKLSGLVGEGLVIIPDELVFGAILQNDVTINGDIKVSDRLNLNGHNLTVNGSITEIGTSEANHSPGFNSIYINGNLHLTGDLYQNGGDVSIDGGSLSIDGDHIIGYVNDEGNYKNLTARYYISNDGTEAVAGSVLAYSMYTNELNTGELHIGGDFRSLGYKFNITPKFYVTMTGAGATRIENVGRSVASASYYPGGNLTIENAEGREVTFAGEVKLSNLTGEGLIIIPDNLRLSATLQSDIVVNGDMTVSNRLNLNNYRMTVNGNLQHTYGRLSFNGGSLIVSDNYNMANSDGLTVSGAYLQMSNENDRMRVGGNVIINSSTNSTLTNGVMYIAGDFTQEGSSSSFNACEKHKVILDGTDVQNITFTSYPSSKLNIVVLIQDEDQYIFSPDPCWNVKGELENILTLPAMLTTIESEAFIGTAADAIRIPEAVNSIALDAFDNDIIIIASSGSYAAEWAQEKGFDLIVE